MAPLLPEVIFNYVLTVEEYVFALSEGNMPENCERARKSVRNYANDFFFHSCVVKLHFSFMPCRERTCVKKQKHILLKIKRQSFIKPCTQTTAKMTLEIEVSPLKKPYVHHNHHPGLQSNYTTFSLDHS